MVSSLPDESELSVGLIGGGYATDKGGIVSSMGIINTIMLLWYINSLISIN